MAKSDSDRLELIVELIGHIQRRLAGKQWNAFLSDIDEIDLTAFRLLHIGEASRKLSDELKARHPAIPWPAIYTMRNIISHEYLGLDAPLIWHTATNDLEALSALCRAKLDRLDS